jgi:O-antigen/teichoic acid export membrane protein
MQPDPSHRPLSRRGILRGLGASYVQAVIGVLVTLIGTPIYLALLGQETYGLYLAVSAWTAYLALFRVGFPQAAGNQMAAAHARHDTDRVSRVLKTSLALTSASAAAGALIGAALIGTGVVTAGLFQGSETTRRLALPLLVTCGAGFLLALPFQQCNAALRALQNVHLEQLILAATRVLGLAAGVGVLWVGLGAVPFAVSQAAVAVFAGAACGIAAIRALPTASWRRSRVSAHLAGEILRPGVHFLLLALSGALIWSTDNIVISMFRSTADVTPYAVSYRLVTLSITWLSMGIGALTPTVTALWSAGDGEKLERLVLQISKLGMAAMTLTAIVLALLGCDFIRIWAGPEAVVAQPVMWTFVATLLIVSFSMGFEVFLVATSKHARYAYVALLEGALNLVLSLVLVRYWGLLGVALGTLTAHLLGSGLFVPRSVVNHLGLSWVQVLRYTIAPLLLPSAATVLAAMAAMRVAEPSGWIAWLFCAAISSTVFLVSYAAIGMNPWERANARRLLDALRRRRLGNED